ncbi:hypothetical protein [Piscinibacter gummiphilus]|nr:hypothetical protein [Piscinibacter gummiphilus]GLS95315.1 hypothetical protein GCM10007918_26070 [Piscinibacter gummiphilus]
MTTVVPADCTLELVSETAVGQYRFGPDGSVSVTIGMKDGPVCAPAWVYRVVSDTSIELWREEERLELWTEIQRVDDTLHVTCRGSRLTFRISP